ncbi:MAG: WecB/TagA/CpsF family glycosyltransferase [Nitrospira sp. CG24A]|nr:MAG: WecB/TagA/CpsF family glycosyltransferase [Nitrospira sp. CG24A]
MTTELAVREHPPIQQIRILGIPVHMVQIPDVVALMTHWIAHQRDRMHWVVVADMHAIIEAHKRPEFRSKIETSDLIVPDGISLIKVARRKGVPLKTRVTGTDLMKAFFAHHQHTGLKHFFFGDTDQTLLHLQNKLEETYPGIVIADCVSPPFRAVTPEEDAAMVQRINDTCPDVLWVGLGLPKQEQWIYEHRAQLHVPLVLGVGAAFKFLAGTVTRAPEWVGEFGLEWLWRFAHEPRRLWRRIMIEGVQFAGHVALELSGLRKYS